MVHQGECRRVTFNKKKPQCFEILNIDDYTESEIEDSWWSEDEQRIQKEQRDKIVESIDKGLKSRRGGSFRGLEKLVVEGYVEMTRRRHRCIDAVMDEQERQWNNLTSNLERIAELSFVNSQQCVKEALQVGQLDERVARIQDVKFIVKDKGTIKRRPHSRARVKLDSALNRRGEMNHKVYKLPERRGIDPPGKTIAEIRRMSWIQDMPPSHFKLRKSTTSVAA